MEPAPWDLLFVLLAQALLVTLCLVLCLNLVVSVVLGSTLSALRHHRLKQHAMLETIQQEREEAAR